MQRLAAGLRRSGCSRQHRAALRRSGAPRDGRSLAAQRRSLPRAGPLFRAGSQSCTRGCRFRESNFRESNSQLSAPELLTGTKNPNSWQCCQGAQNAAEAVNHPECFIPLYII